MTRISKSPEIRKQEIIDTAMRVFYKKGYQATSMADIAKEMHVVQGLCYRYFASKNELFETAMEQYVKESSNTFLEIIHDRGKTIKERMQAMVLMMLNQDDNGRYHDFYEKSGNESLHEQLTLKICKYLIPHVCDEFTELCDTGKLSLQNIEMTAQFIMYGQFGLLQVKTVSFEEKIVQVCKIIELILGIKETQNNKNI